MTDDFSRFSWVFFLATKSETSGIPKKFITEIENQLNHKVNVIRSDNGTEFKNRKMDEFCGQKGIKREYSVSRTPQQNGVVERKNRTLIEAARNMLADSLLPIIFWVEAVNTACYVLNRVLVTKPYNKTPYELIIGRAPSISFMRPFGCPVTILNTLDPLGKFDEKAEEGFLVGVDDRQSEEKNMSTQQYVVFLLWSSISLSYKSSDDKAEDDTVDDDACKKTIQEPASEYDQALKNVLDKMMDQEKEATEQSDAIRKEFEAQCDSQLLQEKITRASSTNSFNIVSTPVNTASASKTFRPVGSSSGLSFVPFGGSFPIDVGNLPHDPLIPELEDTVEIQSNGIFGNAYDDHNLETLNTPYANQSVGTDADFNNMEPSTIVCPIPTTRVHSTHPKAHIIGDPKSVVQTRGMTKKNSGEHAMISYIQKQRRTNHKDFQNCLFASFLSQHEPIKISQALDDESWVEAMQEELLQFKIQKVWTLVDLPSGKKAIEEGIDYEEVFAPVTRVEAIRLFLAFASFMNFLVYQMDVKIAFLYGTFKKEVYVCQPPGPKAWYETLSTYLLDNRFHRGQIDKTLFIKRLKGDILLVQVYVDDIIFGSTKKSLCDEFEQIMHNRFQMSSMGELTFFLGLQVKQKEDGIFISQDKYVGEILKKFGFSSIRTASTPMETNKALTKDEDGEDVDVHLYRSMIGSLMYLTSSRPDIMFSVCACSRFQVQPKVSHLNAVKRIFRYLKGQPKLGLWYPKDSPLILEAFSDSDYAGASLDRKSTTGGKRGRDTKIPQSGGPPIKVGDEAIHKELGDRMERAATTASSLEVEQDSDAQTSTTTARTSANREVELTATIDGQVKTITEASLRRHLKLEDNGGITTLPNSDIFEQLALMGTPSTLQPPNTQPTPDAEEAVPMPHESPLHNKKVKKLEQTVKSTQARRRFRIVVSDDKESLEDPSKQGRKIIKIDQDPSISLVQDEGTSWIQEDIEIQEKFSDDTEVVLKEEEPTKLVEDQVRTAAANLVYIRRSAQKRKDKGNAIMEEDEPVQKKTKKQLEQERLGHEEAIRLQEQIDEEET
ncbi:putative ribonuclease H-like domain-containing protein [Tanacetum coccineum]|uniref:Ribonuclease H-like domain-containing protein n=1 Tax=Tanacetum coccineum TaxID=301880 RepID=A0ABQ5BP62_9ASTR